MGIIGLQVGVVYPQVELGGDPEAVRKFARAAEDLGFDYLLAYDHVLGAVHEGRDPKLWGPYTEKDPFHDPLVMFSYLAAYTPKLDFAVGVLILPQRQTALVARQAADLALFSGDRFRLGVGVGWNYVEYDSLGQDFKTKGPRQEEQIALLRRLWTEPVVTFKGRFDSIDRAGTLPLPNKPIPIWLGGFSDVAFERAARIGDGFIFAGRQSELFDAWATMRERVKANGRDVDVFGGEYLIGSQIDPAQVPERMDAWKKAHGTHSAVVTMGLGLDSVEAHIDRIGQVARALDHRA